MIIRKVKNKEIRSAAQIMAECFIDYPLYDAFFGHSKKRAKQIFYFFWYRLYTRRDYTYKSENDELIISIMRPDDRDRSPLGLLLNPCFIFGFLFHNHISVLRKVMDFSEMEDIYQKKYYDRKKDTYIKAVCVKKEFRNTDLFFEALRQLDDGSSIYAETHSPVNARLYRIIGANVLEKVQWNGVSHYIIKRPEIKKQDPEQTSIPN